jgi:hypothetical protein
VILLEGPVGWESMEKEWKIEIRFLSDLYLEMLFKNTGKYFIYIFSIIIKIETLSDLLFAQ